jgi:hypothetical protein
VNSGEWRLASSSVVGVGHLRRGVGCQDTHLWNLLALPSGGPALVAVLADGAGSAVRSEAGAHLAVALVLREIAALFAAGGGLQDIERGRVSAWLQALRSEVEALATSEGRLPREFSCTLLAAAVGNEAAAFFQVGDGAMVVSRAAGPGFDVVFWPANDEYENVTFFATDAHATDHLECSFLERRIDEVALFSDGLQRLALDYGARTPHEPFFDSMLAPLRATQREHSILSAELAAFLDSPRVNDRTDDDKTLILATRRPVSAAPG